MREGLGQEEARLEVDVHHLVPVGLAEIERVGAADDAGIVDEDVERAGQRLAPARSRPVRRPACCRSSLEGMGRAAGLRDQRQRLAHVGAAGGDDRRAPACASASAMPWPMPVLAPVTSAVRPVRSKGERDCHQRKHVHGGRVHVGELDIVAGHGPDEGVVRGAAAAMDRPVRRDHRLLVGDEQMAGLLSARP